MCSFLLLTYISIAPQLTRVLPESGPLVGGNLITLQGTHLLAEGNITVRISNELATIVTKRHGGVCDTSVIFTHGACMYVSVCVCTSLGRGARAARQ